MDYQNSGTNNQLKYKQFDGDDADLVCHPYEIN